MKGNDHQLRQSFVSDMVDAEVSSEVCEWILVHIFDAWGWKPEAKLPLSIFGDDSDGWTDYIVRATIELGFFRPSDSDFSAALQNKELVTMMDLARLVTKLLRAIPVSTGISILEWNKSEENEVCRWLSSIHPLEYNDQFALKQIIEARLHSFDRSALEKKAVRRLRDVAHELSFAWWPMYYSSDLERELVRADFKQEISSRLNEASVSNGDILCISKIRGADLYKQYLLVRESREGKILTVDFKADGVPVMRANLSGITEFFFRDTKSKLRSIWHAPPMR